MNIFRWYLDELMAEGDLFDIYLTEEARRLNKTVGSLEPAEYHCEVYRYHCLCASNTMDFF